MPCNLVEISGSFPRQRSSKFSPKHQ